MRHRQFLSLQYQPARPQPLHCGGGYKGSSAAEIAAQEAAAKARAQAEADRFSLAPDSAL